MTRSKWLASLAVLGLLLAGGALFLSIAGSRRSPQSPGAPGMAAASGVGATTASPSPSPGGSAGDFRAGEPMKRVMDLYQSESRRVGQIDPDPKATQRRLEEDARLLSTEEIRWLGGQAGDIKNDPDARFFAAYLLGLSHQEASIGVLAVLAKQPLPKSKNSRLVEQERALRASEVEGISHACAEFLAAAKDGLLDVEASQPDEFINDRAHRGLYACQTGKTIEEQDRAALEKLREGRR